ncbi:MAG: zinc ribbon domain-containing protein [Acidobacteria bacterium]|nr:zinc ribbon domain-containing protein [Acidobacteriota bacterium]
MFCPRCGRESSETQRFCKSCGTNLHTVSQAMSGPAVPPAQSAELERRIRDFNKGIKTIFLGIGLAVFFAFVSRSRAPIGIGLMVFVFGLGQMIRALLSAHPRLDVRLQMPGREPASQQPARILDAESRQMVTPTSSTPGSVTEDATLRLGADESFRRSDGN